MSTNNQRQVKLFISSTFRGLYDERDVLAKHVFPEIRRRCQARKVDFVEIDLRWGIPKQQVKSGVAVPVCLGRIDDGRPYFLGLLGERYGSAMTPEQIPVACDQYPWVKQYLKRSITELEILHALFKVGQRVSEKDRQATIERALFYFRDPQYAQTQAKPDYYLDTPTNIQKQNELKQRIRAEGCRITEYQKPADLKELVLEQLWALIDKAYPDGSQPTDLEQENLEHDAFAHSRELVYIQRQSDFERLTAHALGDSTLPLVIYGESGIGKSALLANWAIEYQAKHQDELVFWHFCGSSPASTDPIAMLRRLMKTLQPRFQIEDEIPTTAETVIEQLPLWLAKVHQRVIVIFDGLNQLEINQNTARWLPAFIPANIRLFLSTLSTQSIEGQTFTVVPLSESEQGQLIARYLARFGRQLENDYINRLVAAPQTANPLYLQVILEELRLFGIFIKLGQRLDYYLEAKTIPDLYQKVLARLEDDYQPPEYPHIVSHALSLLLATRRGLSESELLSLLAQPKPLPQAVWSPLYLALSSALVNRAGLLNFFHDYLRQAVEQRYLTDADKKRAVHRQLADFFETLPLDTRQADELPYQLEQAGEKVRLQDCISEIPMFLQLIRDDKEYELWGYWLRLGTQDKMVAAYQKALAQYEKASLEEDLSYELNQLASFFNTVGYYPAAEPLLRRALAIREKVLGAQHSDTAESLNNLATLLRNKGDYDSAEPLFRRALAIYEQVLGAQHPSTARSLNNLAGLLENKGDCDSAEPLYRRALAIYEQVLGAQHPDTANSLNNLALLLKNKGDYDSAEPLYRRALAIYEQVLGAQHPDTAMSLNNLAELLRNKGDYDSAEPLLRRALAISEQVLGAQHPDTAKSLNNLAGLLDNKGDYDSAEPLYRRALAISEQVLGVQHPFTATSLNNLALLLNNKGDYDSAEPLYRRALAILEKQLPNHPNTVACQKNLANLLNLKTNFYHNVTQKQNTKVSRNAHCPCGSGKRYKQCCGKIV